MMLAAIHAGKCGDHFNDIGFCFGWYGEIYATESTHSQVGGSTFSPKRRGSNRTIIAPDLLNEPCLICRFPIDKDSFLMEMLRTCDRVKLFVLPDLRD